MDIRYVAGLFDGEGYVRIARWKKPNSTHIRYQLIAGINMCHFPIIEMLQKRFGGGLNQNRHDLRRENNRICFAWTVGSQVAVTFLRSVEPHSIVKRDEIVLAIKFQNHIDSNPYIPPGPPYEREGREDLFRFREKAYRELMELKKRTFPPLTTKPRMGRPPLLKNGPMDQ